MLPLLERELVQKKKWVTNQDLLDYYAISQVTPGVIAVNVSTFVGARKRGIAGAFVASAGIVTAPICVITIIALFISNFERIVWVQKALRGINVAVTALLTYSVVNFAHKSIKKWWGILFYLGAFCSIHFFKVPSVFVVVFAALLGIVFCKIFKKDN